METQLIKIDEDNQSEVVSLAAKLLKDGKVVGIPTETVYGLAANAFDESAVSEIFRIKGRPADNPLIVHVSNLVMLKEVVAELPDEAILLARKFWPGPLTIVLKKTEAISDLITCSLDTVAVRMPSHPVAKAIIECAGIPVAAPSANTSGRPSTTTAQHVLEDMNGKIPLIVDGGACDVGLESTVITLSGKVPMILRPGIISLDEIHEVLPEAIVSDMVLRNMTGCGKVESPGMKYKHYAPKADVTIVNGSLEKFIEYTKARAGSNVFALCFDGEEEQIEIPSIAYGGIDDYAAQARRLFSVLRMLDKFGAATVYARCPEKTGASLAVFNRLIRAAAFKVVEL